MSNTPLTLKQVQTRFNKDQPKFVGLKNANGEWEVAYNSPKISSKKRMLDIAKHFSKESTPDGIYFFVTKETLHKDHPERSVPVAKGNVRNLPAVVDPPKVTVQERATEEVWDLKTALEKSTDLIRLDFQNQALAKENKELMEEIIRLREKSEEKDPEKESSKAISQFKEIAEMFRPIVDEHFKLKKDRNEIDKRKLALMERGKGPARRQPASDEREDGGFPVDHPKYEKWFALVVAEGTNEELDNECNYLEQADPEYYKELAEKYGVAEAPGSEGEDPEDDNTEEEEDDGSGS